MSASLCHGEERDGTGLLQPTRVTLSHRGELHVESGAQPRGETHWGLSLSRVEAQLAASQMQVLTPADVLSHIPKCASRQSMKVISSNRQQFFASRVQATRLCHHLALPHSYFFAAISRLVEQIALLVHKGDALQDLRAVLDAALPAPLSASLAALACSASCSAACPPQVTHPAPNLEQHCMVGRFSSRLAVLGWEVPKIVFASC